MGYIECSSGGESSGNNLVNLLYAANLNYNTTVNLTLNKGDMVYLVRYNAGTPEPVTVTGLTNVFSSIQYRGEQILYTVDQENVTIQNGSSGVKVLYIVFTKGGENISYEIHNTTAASSSNTIAGGKNGEVIVGMTSYTTNPIDIISNCGYIAKDIQGMGYNITWASLRILGDDPVIKTGSYVTKVIRLY